MYIKFERLNEICLNFLNFQSRFLFSGLSKFAELLFYPQYYLLVDLFCY